MSCPNCTFESRYHPITGTWEEYKEGQECPACHSLAIIAKPVEEKKKEVVPVDPDAEEKIRTRYKEFAKKKDIR